jgi:iron complex outermembrane receptor protein
MKKLILLYVILWCLPVLLAAQQKSVSLSGTVTDAVSRMPLPGASVYIPDLKRGAITDKDGKYLIENLPAIRLLVVYRYVGYTSLTVAVDLALSNEHHASLTPSAIESNEVVITGSAFTSEIKKSSTAVTVIEKEMLINTAADNLISAIAKTPGISEITTGNNVSKPVIRGLGYNRIVILNEGLRQEGQPWGDEHGVEIDQYAADRIEILKGPGSLLYGSDALGGVINILEPIPAPQGTIQSEIFSAYSTNNGLTANALKAEGNHRGFVWRAQGTYKNAASFKTPVERVYNTAFNETGSSAMLGINKKWGYAHLHAGTWMANLGFNEGERDSVSGKFLDDEGNVVSDEDLNSRTIFLPRQQAIHHKIISANNIIIGKNQLRIRAGWQQNNRKEFEAGHEDHGHHHDHHSEGPAMELTLNTFSGDAKLFLAEKQGWEVVTGASGSFKKNENSGEEFLIPDYTSKAFGVFAAVKKSKNNLTANAGLRFDRQILSVTPSEVDGEVFFKEFSASYAAMSGSAGIAYNINQNWNIKFNAGRGFRVPDVSELMADGVHHGTFRYEIGDSSLKPETSLQFDFTLQAQGERWEAELNVFHNQIDRYIYYRNVDLETIETDGNVYPVYRYTQGNSLLQGFELHTDIHLLENMHFDNDLSFVYAVNKTLDRPLPFIPAFRINNELSYEFKIKKPSVLKSAGLQLQAETHLKQNRIDVFETETSGYTLFHAALSLKFGKEILFSVECRNLTDKKYFNHLSRLKQLGILNPGRNITLSLRIPLSF